MSDAEKNQNSDPDYNKMFDELVGEPRKLDTGILLFEDRMLQEELTLSISFAKVKGGFDNQAAKVIQDELNDSWRYHNEIATVSGRIYLADPEITSEMPKEWGSSNLDDMDRVYYEVKNTQLRSHGVEVIPTIDDNDPEGVKVSGIRMGFVFSAPEDIHEHPLLTAFVGELSDHFYQYPTPEEAQAKLAEQWPEQLVIIDLLTKPGGSTNLPARAAMLARKIQEDLQASEEFSQLAEIYVNGRLQLNQELPYITTVNHFLNYFDGDDVTAEDAQNFWVPVPIESPMTVALFDPRFNFFERKNGTIGAFFVGSTYNEEDGDEPEYVSFAAEDIELFRSTKAQRSIAARALAALNIEEAKREAQYSHDLTDNEVSEAPLALRKASRRMQGDSKPEIIKRIDAFFRYLREIAVEVNRAKRTYYATSEDATVASIMFIGDVIKPRLSQDSALVSDMILEFSGKNATRPNVEVMQLKDDTNPDISKVQFGVNSEKPLLKLQDGDSFLGAFVGVEPLIEEKFNQEKESLGFVVAPTMVIELEGVNGAAASQFGVDIVTFGVGRRSLLPMDGSVKITAKVHEKFVSTKEALLKVSETYGRHPIMKQLHKVQRALSSEVLNEFTDLKDITMIKKLGRTIDEMAIVQDVAPLVKVLDEMFVGRTIELSGQVFTREEDLTISQMEDITPDDPIYGRVVDVQMGIVPHVTTFSITNNKGDTIHLPLKTISALRF